MYFHHVVNISVMSQSLYHLEILNNNHQLKKYVHV
jgi:hypothetical protein